MKPNRTNKWMRPASLLRGGIGLLAAASFMSASMDAVEAAAIDRSAEKPISKGSYELISDLEIGGPDADDPAQFYERMGMVTMDADGHGNIYVLDNGNHRVQIFDAKGNFLRSVGQEGEGPGEFSMANRISVNAGGQFAVFDMGVQRVSVFSHEGELLRDQLVEGMVEDMVLTDGGGLIFSTMGGRGILAYDEKGEMVWDHGRDTSNQGGRMINIETDFQTVSTRLSPQSDGDLLFATKAEYMVLRLRKGEHTQTVSRPFKRVDFELEPMGGGDDDGEEHGEPEVVMVVQRSGGGDGDGGGTTTQLGEGDGEVHSFDMGELQSMLPEFVPDIRGILSWPDGRYWVITAEGDGKMVTDEWDAEGRYLKRFDLPMDYGRLEVGADGSLYALAHDEDDYPIIHRLRVEPK